MADTPAVNNADIRTITLTFSEKLDANTIADGVKLYTVNASGDLTAENCLITVAPGAPAVLNVTKTDGSALTVGEEYKIVISSSIRSTNGSTLGNDVVGYFCTNYSFSLASAGISGLNTRSIIICLSDIHLGDKRSIDGGYGWFDKNREALVSFLNQVRQAPNVRELVIAGDMFDEWVAPMATVTLNGLTQSGFLDSIVIENQAIIDAFNNIIKDGDITVTFVTGNHDMLTTSADLQRIMPGISEARDGQGARLESGLGSYTPTGHPEILIEHGHRYDFINAPDSISNRSITATPDSSILPLGFFVTKIGASILGINSPTGFVPGTTVTPWAGNQYMSHITANILTTGIFDQPLIKTGIDGYSESYAISDLVPRKNPDGTYEVNLYQGVESTWNDRQENNMVPVKISSEAAIKSAVIMKELDAQAMTQYFQNAASIKRIVVFGHTHIALINPLFNTKLQKTIYANTGTWIDKATPSMTFVAIIPQKSALSVTEYVNLYQYSQTGITTLDSQSITFLKQ